VVNKKIIIIGGGLTGLAAGCYGRMNGYKTSIFEMHDITGGVCTGWKRKGYTIDGAMNWLVGTKPGTSFYKMWEELGAAQNWQIFNYDRFLLLEDRKGRIFSFYSDAGLLKQEMLKLAPEDKDAISEFIQMVRFCSRLELPAYRPRELYSLIDKIKMVKMLPFLRFFRKWGNASIPDLARRFKNPFLREAITLALGGDMPDMPAFFMLMTLGWLNSREAGYPIGGALPFAQSIERRYLDLGGEIHCKSRVDRILVNKNRAVGIRLADGTEHRGDIVISAADGHTTIFEMLGGKYINDEIRGYYNNPRLFPPLIYIGIGVARRFDDVPPSVGGIAFPLENPISIAGKENKILNVLIYSFDPTLAPEGKTLIRVQFTTDFDYWDSLSRQPDLYKAEKEKIAETVISLLDRRFPGLAGQVEMRDVATPVTWVRYTGNWRGSYEGWLPDGEMIMKGMKKTLPGLENFYMAGQWVEPGGGMPTAALSGRNVIQIICNKDKKTFITTKPNR
jgi:phytoene dehydrogenase-like protein